VKTKILPNPKNELLKELHTINLIISKLYLLARRPNYQIVKLSNYQIMLDKIGIAKRIAQELKDRYFVNLGIGIPTLVNYPEKK
jgi:acyl CoA:acetate/3-ketoacid CoA transferase